MIKDKSIFSSNQIPFRGEGYEKQKDPGARDQLLFRLEDKFRKIPLLVITWPNLMMSYRAVLELFQNLDLLIHANS